MNNAVMVKVIGCLLAVYGLMAVGMQAGAAPPGQTMVTIKGGDYVPLYGTAGQSVTVSSFLLDVFPVTNADYLAFVRQHSEWQKGQVPALFADEDYLHHWQAALSPGQLAPAQAPVTHVSWFAARAYCKQQGKRLPTLDEWEYAARASKDDVDATGLEAFNKLILGWYGKPARLPLPDVGATYMNVWGVWDMHGLSWEWVMDFNAIMISGESRQDASGLDSQFFCAAGSIGTADPNDYAAFMRYAMRGSVNASYTGQNMGFRCASDIRGSGNE